MIITSVRSDGTVRRINVSDDFKKDKRRYKVTGHRLDQKVEEYCKDMDPTNYRRSYYIK